MEKAKQYYTLNENFQLSSFQQLTSFNKNEYAWLGRTLTSWTDENGVKYEPDSTVNFNRMKVDMSANWDLNQYPVSASIKSGHGVVRVTTHNEELPLPAPVDRAVDLSNEQQISIYYDSNLSIDCVPDEDYTAQFMFINGVSKPIDEQYVHSGKTGSKDFKISSEFYLDTGKAGLSVTTINGNTYKFIYDNVPQPLQYRNGLATIGGVQYPFNTQSELTNSLSIALLVDSYGIISSIGANSFSYCSSLSTVNIDNVLSIKSYAFYNSSILSVRFPQLTCINATGVFKDCKNLKYADFPKIRTINQVDSIDSNFYGCTSLANINLPQCSSIYGATFYNCNSLSSINISALKNIDKGDAFHYCSSLSTIYMPLLSGYLPQHTFDGCSSLISIDLAYVHQLNASTFKNCTSLTSIIGNCLTAMEGSDFENCINLSAIDLQYIKRLRKNAFCGCSSLTSANLPLLSSLGDNNDKSSFLSCDNLSSIHVDNEKWNSIGNGYGTNDQLIVDNKGTTIVYGAQGIVNLYNDLAISVDQNAFAYHRMLSSIDIPNVSAIGGYAFSNATLYSIHCPHMAYIDSYAFRDGNGNFSLDLPNLTSLGSYAFLSNAGIAYANMPMLSNISRQTFDGCLNLSAIDAENVQTIDYYAFKNCSSLISVHFPYIVQFPGSSNNCVFQNCSSLVAVDCENISSIGAYTFYNCISLSSVNCPNVKVIGLPNYNQAFSNCINLSSVHFEKLERIASDGASRYGPFVGCSQLSSADFPELTSDECSQSFKDCSSLVSANMPKLLYTRNGTFQNCVSLKQANLHAISSIGLYTFQNCQSLELVNMSANMEVPDVASNAFSGITHPVSIDIPYEKLEEYRANETWAQLENDGKVVFITTDPTAQLVQADGSVVYLTGKNLISEITQNYKDTTVAATIGYIKDEQDE